MYSYEGKIKVVEKLREFDSGFKKREIVLTDGAEQYPQDIKFEFLKDDVELLSGYRKNQTVKIDFTIRGNEYQGKHYVNLVGVKITNLNAKTEEVVIPSGGDDLPF